MIATHSSFIGVYEGAIDTALCIETINRFEECAALGLTHPGQTSSGINKSVKNSYDLDLRSFPFLHALQDALLQNIDSCYALYQSEYPSVKNLLAEHKATSLQVQKYVNNNAGGYYSFHCEAGTLETSRRVSVYTMYLNDVLEGGETEFLHQKIRVKPKQGTVCIFPSGYTHTHRGNPVLSGEDKYILTGWYNFV